MREKGLEDARLALLKGFQQTEVSKDGIISLADFMNFMANQTNADCWYRENSDGHGVEDLYSIFLQTDRDHANNEGTYAFCDQWHKNAATAAYVHAGAVAESKLQAFEDCLDVTFDWLYGESDVGAEQQKYILRSGTNRHYDTGEYHSALGGEGRAAINSLYGDNTNMFRTNFWFDKLNGIWSTGGMVPPASLASTQVPISQSLTPAPEQYRPLIWSRRAWNTATGAWSPVNFGVTSSKWGLWQHYVHCELTENRKKEHAYKTATDSTFDRTYLTRLDESTLGLARGEHVDGAWNNPNTGNNE